MRILMLTHNRAEIGGSYRRAHSLGKALATFGYEITLIASRRHLGLGRIEMTQAGVRVFQMSGILPARLRQGGLDPIDIAQRIFHLWLNPYDLVYGFDHRPAVSLPALTAAWFRHIPYLADWADLWGRGGIAEQRRGILGHGLGWLDHHWERFTRKQAVALTVITTDLARRAQDLGIEPDKLRLVQVGANHQVIRPHPRAEMRVKYKIPSEAHVLVHIGFAPYDVSLLANTFVELARRDDQAFLMLVGSELPVVREVVTQHGFAKHMRWMGMVPYPTLGELMACGDVMLLPNGNTSLNLGRFPNRFGDYIAAGRPIATNSTGDLARIVKTEGIGITAADTPDVFAMEILDLLEKREECERMGKRARRLAETDYSWETIARTVHKLILDLALVQND